MPKSELEKLWDQANDPLLAFLLAVAILSLLLLIPSLWVVVWSVLASFLAFDFLMKRFIKGGSGIFQSALSGSTAAQSKGHAFLTLFAIVMFVTIASSILAESIADGIRASPIAGVMANLVVSASLWFYMDREYFRRPGH